MKEFLEYLITSIVSAPDEVVITETPNEEYTLYMISVAQEDMGTVIGKEGKNIRGIRNMAKAKAIKDDVRIRIELEDKKEATEEVNEENSDAEI